MYTGKLHWHDTGVGIPDYREMKEVDKDIRKMNLVYFAVSAILTVGMLVLWMLLF